MVQVGAPQFKVQNKIQKSKLVKLKEDKDNENLPRIFFRQITICQIETNAKVRNLRTEVIKLETHSFIRIKYIVIISFCCNDFLRILFILVLHILYSWKAQNNQGVTLMVFRNIKIPLNRLKLMIDVLSFYRFKIFLDRPNHFGRAQIILDGYKSFWTGTNHFRRVQFILDGFKSFCTGPNYRN